MDTAGPKYADCPVVEVETMVRAPAAVIWSLIGDVNLPARFSSEFTGATWLDGATGPAPGARFLGRNEHPVAGTWQTVCTIVEFEPERRLGYLVDNLAHPAARWRFTLEPVDPEQIRLSYAGRIGPGPSKLTGVIEAQPTQERRIVAARLAELRTNMTATLQGLKDLAEAEHADALHRSE